jgi:hypothetical protein
MFRIKWRNRNARYGCIGPVLTGLRRYPTHAAAEQQVVAWQRVFPRNTYYIEPDGTS